VTKRRTVAPLFICALLGAMWTHLGAGRFERASLGTQQTPAASDRGLTPGTRVLLDAHNSYPSEGRWEDRIDRALGTGLPVAIEQDLVWYRDPATGQARSIVSHGEPFTGQEPTLDQYFFQRVRPLMERALRDDRRETWPALVLNLDFKTDEPEHHRAVWDLLGRYDSWLCTAQRTASAEAVAPIVAGPLLVLTGEADAQEKSFHDAVPAGDRLRLFGAVHRHPDGTLTPKSNYRRWSNNPWSIIEPEGQPRAGDWTADDEKRLEDVVSAAHRAGLWIRFYTLNGHDPADTANGWSASYNFGSLEAVSQRWRAAIRAGVDFVAVDQYEQFADVRRAAGTPVIK
jgi:hypothetical protein